MDIISVNSFPRNLKRITTMFDLFLDIFAYRDNRWTRMDSGCKFVTALVAILCILLSTQVILPLVILVLCLGGLFTLGIPPRLVFMRLAAPMGTVLVLILLQSFLSGSTKIISIPIGGWELTLMREGLWKGLLIGTKVLGAVSVTLLLCSVTPAHKIFHALRRLHVPREWVEIAMLMYRYIFSLLDHASEGAAAQRLRLGYTGMRRSVASLGTLAGTVLVRSFDQARKTHEAMTLRGYTGVFPFAPEAPGNGHWWKTATACTVIFMVYLLLEWGPV